MWHQTTGTLRSPYPSPMVREVAAPRLTPPSREASPQDEHGVERTTLPRVQGCGAPAWGCGGDGATTLLPARAALFFISFLF